MPYKTQQAATDLRDLTKNFAEAGQGPQSDADRAATELALRKNEVEKTVEQVDVATAKLNQQLSLDGNPRLAPLETSVIPIQLIPSQDDLPMLVETGLRSRNELASAANLVNAACAQLKRERASLILPNLAVMASYGGFGGGQGNDFGGNFSDRFDLDTFAYWDLRNFGVGERAARNQAAARVSQAQAEQNPLDGSSRARDNRVTRASQRLDIGALTLLARASRSQKTPTLGTCSASDKARGYRSKR